MKELDAIIYDKGCYRKVVKRSNHDGETPVVMRSTMILDSTEDAIIAALDAGLTPEEIADIMMGAIS